VQLNVQKWSGTQMRCVSSGPALLVLFDGSTLAHAQARAAGGAGQQILGEAVAAAAAAAVAAAAAGAV